jgi:hypothetical protein
MKSWTVSWLSLKTKVEPGLRVSRVMSGDWRRLHRVRRGFQWFTRKPLGSLVDPQSQDRRTEDGGAASSDRSDQWVWPVWPVGTGPTGEEHRSDRCAMTQSRDFEAEDTRRDRKACVEAKQVCDRWACVRWCYEDNFPKCPWWVCILVYALGVI